jgi:hypothetical protein
MLLFTLILPFLLALLPFTSAATAPKCQLAITSTKSFKGPGGDYIVTINGTQSGYCGTATQWQMWAQTDGAVSAMGGYKTLPVNTSREFPVGSYYVNLKGYNNARSKSVYLTLG